MGEIGEVKGRGTEMKEGVRGECEERKEKWGVEGKDEGLCEVKKNGSKGKGERKIGGEGNGTEKERKQGRII